MDLGLERWEKARARYRQNSLSDTDSTANQQTSKPNQVLIDGTTMAWQMKMTIEYSILQDFVATNRNKTDPYPKKQKEDEAKFEDFVNHGK
jgi:hypothetical protein